MARASMTTAIIAFCAGVFLVNIAIVCAESSGSQSMSINSLPTSNAQSLDAAHETERGKRGRVQAENGLVVGEVEDFLIESEKGCVAYGVLTHAGRDAPERFVVLPWILLRLDPADPTMSNFHLYGQHDLINAAPRVSQSQWTTSAVTDWLGPVAHYWATNGIRACATPDSVEARVIKASEVIGIDIQTDRGSKLGTIRELILDGERGVVASVVVGYTDPLLPIQRTFFTLPWTSLYLNISHHTVTVHLGAHTDL